MSKDKKEIQETGKELEKDVANTPVKNTGEEFVEEVITKVDQAPKTQKTEKPAAAKPKAVKVEVEKPQEAEVEKPKTAKVEVEGPKDPVLDFDIDPKKTYTFKLKSESFRYLIPNVATVYDEAYGLPREIRLTDTGDSPFVEEQHENAQISRKTLSFVNGVLSLKGTQAPAIRYLLAYDGYDGKSNVLPGNRTLKGLYTLFVPEEEEQKALDKMKNKIEAQKLILEADDAAVEKFVTGIKNRVVEGNTARIEALNISQEKPELVINSFNNPVIGLKADLIRAVNKGLIAVVDSQIVSATGKILYTSTGKDVLLDAAKEVAASTAKGNSLNDVLAEV